MGEPYELTRLSPSVVAVALSGGPSRMFTMGDTEQPVLDRTISGTVTSDGRPVAGAIVLASDDLTQALANSLSARFGATTGADGHYELATTSDQGLVMLALHRGAGWSRPEHVPAGSGDVTVDLHISPAGAVRGTATYGDEPARARAMLQPASGTRLRLVSMTSDDGVYAFEIVPPGEYELRVGLAQTFDGGASRYVAQTIVVDSGQTTIADVELPVGVTVAVIVEYPEDFEPTIVSYAFEPDDEAEPEPKFGAIFGGGDATKIMQYHDLPPGPYRLCVKMYHGATIYSDTTVRCTNVTVTAAPSAQEAHVSLR